MRSPMPPLDVSDIGVYGQFISSFLYKLKYEHRKGFDAIVRTVKSIIPAVESLDVELGRRRGTLEIFIYQGGTDYSSRVVSEGTLRVLGLCAIVVNPWSGSLVSFEEPENGIHPRRIELTARMLVLLAMDAERQVIVTTHSPLFCNAILKESRSIQFTDVALFNLRGVDQEPYIQRYSHNHPLFRNQQYKTQLLESREDTLFEELVLRGLIDG